ncbi:hypothetical protein I7I53_11960 [Histoplasma capsulatum var. duboisii H88]|uniref:Uncharacterized protein n=1 Tax=Ajellomyces capsulatus (strain H88) TaxID=544711 RepID=A0A8A1LZW0_AJEC8|nr:hypothetical protein I7I53_11960 [Histoplasma capsulatum var. duboisii H88]
MWFQGLFQPFFETWGFPVRPVSYRTYTGAFNSADREIFPCGNPDVQRLFYCFRKIRRKERVPCRTITLYHLIYKNLYFYSRLKRGEPE